MLGSLLALALMQTAPGDRGSDLFSNCQAAIREIDSPTGGVDADLQPGQRCSDYISGLADGLSQAHVVCFGETTKLSMVRVYVAFMQVHPKYMGEYQATGFYTAMLQAYPCPIRLKS
jgi:hypothetical protein